MAIRDRLGKLLIRGNGEGGVSSVAADTPAVSSPRHAAAADAPDVLALDPAARVRTLGHRAFIGGQTPEMWFGIGRMQYHYLVSQGLRPHHVFLDVACGALRLGQYLIPFLDEGNYQGIEGEAALIDEGLAEEVLYGLGQSKAPRFVCNYAFDVRGLKPFDYAIAQSLLTHLNAGDIAACFAGVAERAQAGSRFYVTWFEGDEADNPDGPSHAQMNWYYPFARLAELAAESGWRLERIGDWGHPRGQMMALARRT